MKFPSLFLMAAAGFVFPATLVAQVEIPSNPTVTPKKFATRKVSGGVDPGASVDPGKSSAPVVRNVTHIVLYQERGWTSTEGKTLEAKLIAFEDMVSTSPAAGVAPVMPPPPEHPTVVRDGKVRLLIDRKPVVVALEKLSEADRQLIATLESSLAAKPPAGR